MQHNRNLSACGTCLQGEIDANYSLLTRLFGEPTTFSNGDKVDAEWILDTVYGIATIYNYKNGQNYEGKDGIPTKDITEWHIGGNKNEVAPYMQGFIHAHQVEKKLICKMCNTEFSNERNSNQDYESIDETGKCVCCFQEYISK